MSRSISRQVDVVLLVLKDFSSKMFGVLASGRMVGSSVITQVHLSCGSSFCAGEHGGEAGGPQYLPAWTRPG